MALWDGRFSKETDARVAAYSASVAYDRRLYRADIAGSMAHARMLGRIGVLSEDEVRTLVAGLEAIRERLDHDRLPLRDELEDIHMNIESTLTDEVGAVGAKLHSGRSRNDQVATDERLYLREEIDRITAAVQDLQRALVDLAERHRQAILPGFTHMQHAQPVLFAHHLLAYVEMLARDCERLGDCRKRVNRLPLGAGALAGSTLPLDREGVAEELGFAAVLQNSMDAVADRDYLVEFLAALAVIAMHTSRLCEDVILWVSQEFAFIELDDAFCTGSSLMPQKKNPDVAELARGKTGRVYGHLLALLTTLKGLPLTYNRDLQEDKEGVFDSIDTVTATLATLAPMMATAQAREDRMLAAASDPALMATDLAEWLVLKGVPFRDAHHQVGRFVGLCRERGVALDEAGLELMREAVPQAEPECLKLFDPRRSVEARDITGGTAPRQVRAQIERWKGLLETATHG